MKSKICHRNIFQNAHVILIAFRRSWKKWDSVLIIQVCVSVCSNFCIDWALSIVRFNEWSKWNIPNLFCMQVAERECFLLESIFLRSQDTHFNLPSLMSKMNEIVAVMLCILIWLHYYVQDENIWVIEWEYFAFLLCYYFLNGIHFA